MNNLMTVTEATTHQLYDALLGMAGRRGRPERDTARDRGAVSLEQVLWFAAAGVAVAVIAGILFNRITNEAGTVPINTTPAPVAP
ncbi:MAG: hypothetical protein ABIP17_12920 [Ilumatobacteraceae bacterium]